MVADIRVHAKLLRSLQHPTFVTPWTVACQAPLSIGFSWQEYWSGLPCPPPGGLPTQGSNPCLLGLLHCRWVLYHWATKCTPKLLEENFSFSAPLSYEFVMSLKCKHRPQSIETESGLTQSLQSETKKRGKEDF